MQVSTVSLGDGWNPSPLDKEKGYNYFYATLQLWSPYENRFKDLSDLNPKYRKRTLLGQVAICTRDILRQIAAEHEINNMNPSYNKQIYRSQRKGKIQEIKI